MTADVVDAHGVIVPDADNALSFHVDGAGRLVGLDNGREEDAENYKASTRQAFNGKALAIVAAGDRPGPITVTVSAGPRGGADDDLRRAGARGDGAHQGPARAYVGDGNAGAPPPPPQARPPMRATPAPRTPCPRP